MDLSNITQTAGANNSPGFGQVILLARYNDIEVIPPIVSADPSGNGTFIGLATVSTDITLKAGKKFIKIQTNNESTDAVSKSVGEVGSKAFETSFSTFIPSESKEALALATAVKNDRVILFAKDLDGNIRMIGTENYPCVPKEIETNSGKERGNKKGVMLSFESVAPHPAPIFTGMFKEYPSVSAGAAVDVSTTIWKL